MISRSLRKRIGEPTMAIYNGTIIWTEVRSQVAYNGVAEKVTKKQSNWVRKEIFRVQGLA